MMRAMKQARVILDRLRRREATPLGHQLENRALGPFRILSVTQRIPVAGLFVVVTLTSEHFGLVGFALLSIRFLGGNHSSNHILRRRSVFCIRYYHKETRFRVGRRNIASDTLRCKSDAARSGLVC
jgi:hypothetical protein